MPESPRVLSRVISPPLRLISRFIPGFPEQVPRRAAISSFQPPMGILFDESPDGLQPRVHLAFNLAQFIVAEFPAVRPALHENVILDLWFGPGAAHRDPRFVLQIEDRHLLFW